MKTKAHPPKKHLHFDFHTMPGIRDVGKCFDFERIARYITDCGADTITFPFRCNQGFAYYPTRIGTVHPSLDYDLFGKLLETCHNINVQLIGYTNASVCVDAWRRNPAWSMKTPEPSAYNNTICSNSPYTELLCRMISEVAEQYDLDGFFLDFGYDKPCICENCLRLMESEGIDWKREPEKHQAFAIRSSMKKYHRLCDTVRKANPNLLLQVNGIPFEEKAPEHTYFEFECIPTSTWGYHQLPVFSHYLRNIGTGHVLNMTGRFHGGWGDFGGIRPQASLEYDVFYGIANTMHVTIGDHFHPRGDMYEPVMELVKKIFAKVNAIEEWTREAKAETEIAVIAPQSTLEGVGGHLDSVIGAVRILCELKQQFDVLSDKLEWKHDYKVLILPDETRISPGLQERIRNHLAGGGTIISSMYSGLPEDSRPRHTQQTSIREKQNNQPETGNAAMAPEGVSSAAELIPTENGPGDFVFPEWGVRWKKTCSWDPSFLSAATEIAGFPDMPVTCIRRGAFVETLPGTEILVRYIAPCINRVSREEYFFQYLPPDHLTEEPCMTRTKQVTHFAFPLFSAYFESGRLEYRTLVRHALQSALPNPMDLCENTPSYVKLFITSQAGRRMIHLLSSYPEKRTSGMEVIEDPISVSGMKLRVRLDGRTPRRIHAPMTGEEIPFLIEKNYVALEIPQWKGYQLIVMEDTN